MAKQQKGKGKAPDYRPARTRYWESGKLAKRKVRAYLRNHPDLTEAEARRAWVEARGGRRMRTARRAGARQ